jgi:hypothetical protein
MNLPAITTIAASLAKLNDDDLDAETLAHMLRVIAVQVNAQAEWLEQGLGG